MAIPSWSLDARSSESLNRYVKPEFFQAESLQKMEDYLFQKKSTIRTGALLIQKDGQLIYERYDRGYKPSMKYKSWSMAKSVTGALIGIAEKKGLLHHAEPLSQFANVFPELPPLKSKIKIQDFLQMSSGIEFREGYDDGPERSDVTAMLYRNGNPDTARYVLSRRQIFLPGERFSYSSGDSNVLMAALKGRLDKASYDRFPFDSLFSPLGIDDVTFEQDKSGTFLGSTHLFLKPRDFLKLGQLYLQKGKWNDLQIVPAEWVEFQTRLNPGFYSPHRTPSARPYGADLWLNIAVPEVSVTSPYPAIPANSFLFLGYQGQYIVVIPDENMVIVRLADDDVSAGEESTHGPYMLASIMKAVGHSQVELPDVKVKIPGFNVQHDEYNPVTVLDPGWKFATPQPQASLAKKLNVGSQFAAREYCSCRWVIGQTHTFCKNLVHKLPSVPQFLYFQKFDVDEANKSVTIQVLVSQKGVASVKGQRIGCQLDSVEKL